MNELSPPGGSEGYEACDDEGAASWTHRKPSPHRGEGGPKGRMRGRMRGTSSPWAPSSVSLCSTASPWKGEAIMGHAMCAPTAQHRRRTASSAQSLPPSFASQMPPPSSEGGFFPWPPLTRGLSSAARLGERSPRFPCKARQGCCALHITGELPLLWDVFIHLLEIGRYCAFFRTQGQARRKATPSEPSKLRTGPFHITGARFPPCGPATDMVK